MKIFWNLQKSLFETYFAPNLRKFLIFCAILKALNSCTSLADGLSSKRRLAYRNPSRSFTFTKKRIGLFLRAQLQFTASPEFQRLALNTLHHNFSRKFQMTELDITNLVEQNMPWYCRLHAGVKFMQRLPHMATGKIAKKELKQIEEVI